MDLDPAYQHQASLQSCVLRVACRYVQSVASGKSRNRAGFDQIQSCRILFVPRLNAKKILLAGPLCTSSQAEARVPLISLCLLILVEVPRTVGSDVQGDKTCRECAPLPSVSSLSSCGAWEISWLEEHLHPAMSFVSIGCAVQKAAVQQALVHIRSRPAISPLQWAFHFSLCVPEENGTDLT